MIGVAGLNSAIDKLIDVDVLTPGHVLRTRVIHAWPGGKGVHVASCAAALDQPVRLTGLVDDGHREWFVAWLRARHVEFHAIDTPTPIRTCLAIRESAGRITEILEAGPAEVIAGSRDPYVYEFLRASGVSAIGKLAGGHL